ncbi:MAG: hypothetical protein ABI064_00170 [Acidobacteriaceae bacterium]
MTTENKTPVAPQLLPGMAAIAMFLLLITMLNAFAAIGGAFGTGPARYGIFVVCSLLLLGVFGLLRTRRWGWALCTAGCLAMAGGDTFLYVHNHTGFFAVRGLLELCFFLYLVRTEVRERLRR